MNEIVRPRFGSRPAYIAPQPMSDGVPTSRVARDGHDGISALDFEGGIEAGLDVPNHTMDNALFAGNVMVQAWATSSSSGRTAKFRLVDDTGEVHPFRGLRVGRGQHKGHRLRISIVQYLDDGGSGVETGLYGGDGSLVWWGDDCSNGMRVTLRFETDEAAEDWHPLKGVVADPRHGEHVFLAVWAVADDEDVEAPADARRSSRPFNSLGPVQQSQIKCRLDERFQNWCQSRMDILLDPEDARMVRDTCHEPRAVAEGVVRAFLGVTSRSVMSLDTAEGMLARTRWRELMRAFEAR